MMKKMLCRMLSLALLLGGLALAGAARAEEADRYFGLWVADGVAVEIFRGEEEDQVSCQIVFAKDDSDSDVWSYPYCWIDGGGILQCANVTRRHLRYDALWEILEETDWSLNDLAFARFEPTETGLRYTDDGLDAPIDLVRLGEDKEGRRSAALAYVGKWKNESSTLRVEDCGVAYLFTVTVTLDEKHDGRWVYTCRYDADGGRMASISVSPRRLITYTQDSTIEEDVGYDNSKAVFTLEGGSLRMTSDVTDGDGEEMTFERAGE